MKDDELRDYMARKILPRNLTANAAYAPPGNPAGTRLESAPDNCFPGYAFDQRNLESAFFPGLRFTFHLGDDGVMVTEVLSSGPASAVGITSTHLPLFLWGLMGRTRQGEEGEHIPCFSLEPLGALEVWARIHDLMPGRVAILLGRQPPRIPGVPGDAIDQLKKAFHQVASRVEQTKESGLRWIALVGDRASYLDDNGVIDPAAYGPGDLTRSLCAPWQFDFHDCVCSYWAGSRPDVVTSADGKQPFAYYMRADRATMPPPVDARRREERKPGLDYAPLIGGAWNSVLPVVVNDREVAGATAPLPLTFPPAMSLETFLEELRYLATVEHALAVEYLYAHYSLKAPMKIPNGAYLTPERRRIFAAASEVFGIAVDEMKHLRWVNEALELLQQRPELGRADCIGRQLEHPFELLPLTAAQLAWFIKVEEPSQHENRQTPDVDGMYVKLLGNVDGLGLDSDVAWRLKQLIKLLIDEGNDHYHRFISVREELRDLDESQYLRLGLPGEPYSSDGKEVCLSEDARQLLADSDACYERLLVSLAETFAFGDRAGGLVMEQSRRTMQNMHEINHRLAEHHVGPRFTMPTRALPLGRARTK